MQRGVLAVLFAGTLWGCIGLFSRMLTAYGMTSIQLTSIRCIVAGLSMFFFLTFYNRPMLRIRLKDIWMFVGTGVIGIIFFNVCYFQTIARSTLSLSAILLYTAPSFVIVLSWLLFKEPLTRQKLSALFLAFVGCVLVSSVTGNLTGSVSAMVILTGLGSGLGYALYTIFGKIALGSGYSAFTATAYTYIVAGIALLPFGDVGGIVHTAVTVPASIGPMILIGIVSTMLPSLFYTLGLATMEAGRASVLAFIEPMVATLLGTVFFGEAFTLMHVLGISLILVSLMVVSRPRTAE